MEICEQKTLQLAVELAVQPERISCFAKKSHVKVTQILILVIGFKIGTVWLLKDAKISVRRVSLDSIDELMMGYLSRLLSELIKQLQPLKCHHSSCDLFHNSLSC